MGDHYAGAVAGDHGDVAVEGSLGLGVGAVSTVNGRRWRTTPRLGLYLAALGAGRRPPRRLELVPEPVRRAERVMLGLRLDEPLPLAQFAEEVDAAALGRLEQLGLARTVRVTDRAAGAHAPELTLTRKGRLLGDAVTADLLA